MELAGATPLPATQPAPQPVKRGTMMRASIRVVESETGSVIVMVAVTLVVLLGFLALGIDLGMLFAARTEAQRAADSAALAGASAFVENPPGAAAAPARAPATAHALRNR